MRRGVITGYLIAYCIASDAILPSLNTMLRIGIGTTLLCIATVMFGQSQNVLPTEPTVATSTKTLSEPPSNPRDKRLDMQSRQPEVTMHPEAVAVERSPLQPTDGSRALIAGQWVSPQWSLGQSSELPIADPPEIEQKQMASTRFQPTTNTRPRALASGLDKRIEPQMVKRYAHARVVRFLAPREPLENLFEQIGLDDLNRYQFRRNPPDTIPVERVSE